LYSDDVIQGLVEHLGIEFFAMMMILMMMMIVMYESSECEQSLEICQITSLCSGLSLLVTKRTHLIDLNKADKSSIKVEGYVMDFINKYLEMCWKEAMRLHCPVPFAGRKLTEPIVLGTK
jgi:hypothetical protein